MADGKSRSTEDTGDDEAPLQDDGERALLRKYGDLSCMKLFLEWKHCISSVHQFHQYYIYGELDSCKVQKERMYNCFKWKTMGKSKDKARNELFESLEAEKIQMRDPGVPWKLRKEPPSDWK